MKFIREAVEKPRPEYPIMGTGKEKQAFLLKYIPKTSLKSNIWKLIKLSEWGFVQEMGIYTDKLRLDTSSSLKIYRALIKYIKHGSSSSFYDEIATFLKSELDTINESGKLVKEVMHQKR